MSTEGREPLLALSEWNPVMAALQWPALVALAAHLLYMHLLNNVRLARKKHRIWPPATSGHPDFDRVFRVSANFVEQFPSFISSMLLCALLVDGAVAGALGAVWVAFRVLHSERYAARRLTWGILWYTGPQYIVCFLMYLLPALRVLAHLGGAAAAARSGPAQ